MDNTFAASSAASQGEPRMAPTHEDMSFATIWEHIADAVPDHPAVVWGDTVRTYGELDQRASRLVTAFGELGIGRGSMVGFYLHNRPEFFDAMFATFKVRAIPANVNFRYMESELAYLIDNADLDLLLYPTSLADRIADAVVRANRAPVLVAIDDGVGELVPGSFAFEDLVAGYEPAPRIRRDPTDLVMVYTGGTTGLPKGVEWQQRETTVGAWNRAVEKGYTEPTSPPEVARLAAQMVNDGISSAVVAAPPLIHGTGIATALAALASGQTVALLTSRSFDPAELCSLVESKRAHSLTIVGDAFARPVVRELDAAVAEGRGYDWSSLERITSSGTMWSAPMKSGLHRHTQAALIDGLAASEGAGFASMVTRPGDDPATGRFQLGPLALVIDDHGQPVSVGEVGQIAVAGAIPLGYRNDAERTEATFRTFDGVRYAVPGDFARLEEDRMITLLGRGSVCINTSGEKVFPEEVEEVIKENVPGVEDVIVVGGDDPERGEVVCAVLSLGDGHEPPADIRAHIHEALRTVIAGYKIPRRVVVVDQVLRAASGKADYRWAKAIADGSMGPVP